MLERVADLKDRAKIKEKQQEVNKAVIEHYSSADRFYIDKHIESINLLQPEVQALEKIVRQSNFVENEGITARLNFLKQENRLRFAEGVVQSYPLFSETGETLVKSVEVDLNDLQNILSKIEGVEIGEHFPGENPPQLLITEFKMEKKNVTDDNEVFNLNLKLIKREFNP